MAAALASFYSSICFIIFSCSNIIAVRSSEGISFPSVSSLKAVSSMSFGMTSDSNWSNEGGSAWCVAVVAVFGGATGRREEKVGCSSAISGADGDESEAAAGLEAGGGIGTKLSKRSQGSL